MIPLVQPICNAVEDNKGGGMRRRGLVVTPTAAVLRAANDWTEAECTTIASMPTKHQPRIMIILRHNRDAYDEGLHFITLVQPVDTTISCYYCDYTPEMEMVCKGLTPTSVDAQCHRVLGIREQTRDFLKCNEYIYIHNNDASQRGAHTTNKLRDAFDATVYCLRQSNS